VNVRVSNPVSNINALVAQLVEVSHLECEGCQFESDRGHRLVSYITRVSPVYALRVRGDKRFDVSAA
jgi:hypothetical protein